MKLARLFREFFESEKAGGLLLVLVTILSLLLANSPWNESYVRFWHIDLGGHTMAHWINDGLMTIFFLLIGLELEREIYAGELSNLKKASLPLFAALGGMVFPAGIYLLLNFGTFTQDGAGIPTATDIAFAIGILSLLGNRVPLSLKIFLTALAVIDDLGAIIIIAVFYTGTLHFVYLFAAFLVFGILIILNRFKIHNLIFYVLGGIIMWYFMLHSGVHPTVSGVMLAFAIPFDREGETSLSFRLQHHLHRPVAYLVLPLFAMANTAIMFSGSFIDGLTQNYTTGIIAGLLIGKPLGILIFSYAGVLLGLSVLPSGLKWINILGIGFLAGIGFTMSIFITLLAFESPELVNNSKIAILVGSVIAGALGYFLLRATLKTVYENDD